MKKPHTITIYNEYKGEYLKSILHNVYWYGTDSINISGKGIVEAGAINIIIDGDNLLKYVTEREYKGDKNTFTIQRENRIILGEGPDIVSVDDIPNNFKIMTVFGIDENLVGSSIDNILVTGK